MPKLTVNQANSLSAVAPFTSSFENIVNLGTKPLPGLTYFKVFIISLSLPGSWWANWALGKPRTLKLHDFLTAGPYLATNAFSCVYVGTVRPQKDATLTTRTTSPLYALNSIVSAPNSGRVFLENW